MPVAGGAIQTIVAAGGELLVDGESLYLSSGYDISVVPVSGGIPQVLVSAQPDATLLWEDASDLYWINWNPNNGALTLPTTGTALMHLSR